MLKNPDYYSTIQIRITDLDTELLPEIFFQEGCSGIEEVNENYWKIYFKDTLPNARVERLLSRLFALNPSLHKEDIKIQRQMTRDWLAEWKEFFRPLKIGNHVWIYPPWEKMHTSKDDIHLIIDPQMAFGTGHHETTRLMIELTELYLQPGDNVLDVGTGSGILAILAQKKGAGQVCASDIDPEAITNARHNAMLNHVNQIEFIEGDVDKIPKYEHNLILANINRQVLQRLLSALVVRLCAKGTLILSGLLEQDESIIIKEISSSLSLVEKRKLKEWRALVFKN